MTTEEIQKAARHALYLQDNYSLEEALAYLDQNFDKGTSGNFFSSDYAKVQSAWDDLIQPDSAFGERARQASAQREANK